MALLRRNSRRPAGRMLAWIMLVLAAGTLTAPAAAQTLARELEVQAVFLLNLTRFVRWPEGVFATENAPLLIGVLADDPLGAVLEEAAGGEAVGKHPIAICRIRSAADLEGCQVVYFSKAQFAEAVPLLASLRGRPVLTVSDAEGIHRLGGHVQMYNRGGQLKLRLQVENLKRARLTASAQLLRVVEVVGEQAR